MQTLICSLNPNDFDPEPPWTVQEVVCCFILACIISIPFIMMIEFAR